MTGAVVAALIGGAAVGALITGLVTVTMGRANWRRDDQHRHAVAKRDAYLQLVRAMTQLIGLTEKFTPEPGLGRLRALRMLVAFEMHGRKVTRAEAEMNAAQQVVEVIGHERVRRAAWAVRNADTTDEKWIRLAAFVAAARADLATPSDNSPVARWRRKRFEKRQDAEVRKALERGPLSDSNQTGDGSDESAW